MTADKSESKHTPSDGAMKAARAIQEEVEGVNHPEEVLRWAEYIDRKTAAPETARQRDEAWAANVQDRLSIIELTCQRDVLLEAAEKMCCAISLPLTNRERAAWDALRAAIADTKGEGS